MDSITGISLINTAGSVVSSLGRFIPKPRTSARSFSTVVQDVGSTLSDAGSSLVGGLGSDLSGMLQLQIEAQKQMLIMTTVSNIEKTKHETQMVAARNIRVG